MVISNLSAENVTREIMQRCSNHLHLQKEAAGDDASTPV